LTVSSPALAGRGGTGRPDDIGTRGDLDRLSGLLAPERPVTPQE
jgi:hypothetical protein